MISFIGAGPGDPDLITVKGKKLIDNADVIVYAGSLVNPEVLSGAKDSAKIYNSASMTLEEVIEGRGRKRLESCKSSYRRPCDIRSSPGADGYFR